MQAQVLKIALFSERIFDPIDSSIQPKGEELSKERMKWLPEDEDLLKKYFKNYIYNSSAKNTGILIEIILNK